MRSKALVVAITVAGVLGWTGFAAGGVVPPVSWSSSPTVVAAGAPTAVTPARAAPSAPTPMSAPTTLSSAARLAVTLAHLPNDLSQAPWIQSLTENGSKLTPLTSLPNLNLLEHPETPVADQVHPGYVAQPAPLGLADFGLGATPYAYTTPHFLGQVTLSVPPNVTDPASTRVVEPGGAPSGYVGSLNEFGVQLNTVASNITFPGSNSGFFWTQNVVDWNDTGLHFVDDTFNLTTGFPVIDPGTIYSGCNNNTTGVDTILFVYGGVFQCVGGTIPVSAASYPVTLQLYNNASVNTQGRDQIAYGYRLVEAGTGQVFTGYSDIVVFNNPSAPSAPPTAPTFSVDGSARTPLGLLRDAELDLVGDIGGDNAVFRSLNGTLILEYSNLSSAGWQNVPSAYNFGTDTGETSTGIADYWEPNETLVVNQGPSMLYGLWHAVPSVSVASGELHLAGTITPSYGFVFVSNTPPVLDPMVGRSGSTFDNMSWLPTNASGGFDTYLPPLGAPWTTQYYVQAFADGFGEVNGSAVTANDTSYTLALPLAPGTLDAPLYMFSNAQAAELARNVSGSSSVPYTFRDLTPNVNFSFNHLNDYDFPSFELFLAQGVSQAVTVGGLLQGEDSPAGNFYIGDGPANGLLTPTPPVIGPLPNFTSQINFLDGAGATVVNQTVSREGEVVLWRESGAVVSNVLSEDFSGGIFVGDCHGAIVESVQVDYDSAGVQDVGSSGTAVSSVDVGLFGLGVETYSTSDASYVGLHVGEDATAVEGGDDVGLLGELIGYEGLAYYDLAGTVGTRVSNVTVDAGYLGVLLEISRNLTLSDVVTNETLGGVALEGTANTTIHALSANGDDLAAELLAANRTNITALSASDGGIGVALAYNTTESVVARSVFYGNSYDGVEIIYGSTENLVYDNSFFLNNGSSYVYSPAHIQAFTVVGNAFNQGRVGNFWADWHSFTDGVLNPYPISNGVSDEHPLTRGLDTYFVTVSEIGLPAKGKQWTFAIAGSVERSGGTRKTPTVATLTVAVPNGTFGYVIAGPAGYRASSPVGTLTVAGANVSRSVTFTPGSTSKLTFAESGLGAGTSWCVVLAGSLQSCSTSTVAFANLTPGAYPFAIENFSGPVTLYKIAKTWVVGNSGTAVLVGSEKVLVRYAYVVGFLENLPGPVRWGVTVGGQTQYTSVSFALGFLLMNGTYTYHIHPPAGYLSSTLVGQFVVEGSEILISLQFTPRS